MNDRDRIFLYTARTPQGETIRGRFRGSRVELIATLRRRQAILLSIREVAQRLQRGRFSEADFLSGIEQLYHLMESGMRLDQALKTLLAAVRKKETLSFWQTALAEVQQGVSFSRALVHASEGSGTGWRIPQLYVSILSVGEDIGDLDGALKRLVSHLEFRAQIRTELKSALSYPLFLLFMSCISVGVVVGFIVPRFAAFFTPEQMAGLPLLSRIIFALAALHGDGLHTLFVLLLCTILALYLFREQLMPWLRKLAASLLRALPPARAMVRDLDLSDVYSGLGGMLSGGIDLYQALVQVADIPRTPDLRALLQQTSAQVKEGQAMHTLWRDSGIIPPEDASLVAVGENSARLPSLLLKLGERRLERFRLRIKSFMTLLEPVMILGLGLLIGLIVAGILLAVLSMTDIT